LASPEMSLSNRLEAAATAVLTGTGGSDETSALLRYLGYDDGDTGAAAGRARMLRAAAVFRRVFRLPMPDAPALVFFGAEADPACLGSHNAGLSIAGFAGSGLDPRRAFESCVGEGIEYLSQFAQPDDPLEHFPAAWGRPVRKNASLTSCQGGFREPTRPESAPVPGTVDLFGKTLDPAGYRFVEAVVSACGVPVDHAVSWIAVRRLVDGASCWFPADLCLRRAAADFIPPLKLSTGCAAGVTREAATLRALLELIERDAVALWWRGGRRGRAIAADSDAGHTATRLLEQVRQGHAGRRTALLDITSDLGIPVVAAFSSHPDGFGFALGLGARTTLAEAATAAIFEMCQSELSLHVIAAKRRESGDAALNESDRCQLARATMLDTRECTLLHPDGAAPVPQAALVGDPIEALVHMLAARGIVAYSLDLTRPRFGVPVVRVIAPALQSEPCEITGDRLARAIAETGGGARYSGGIALL
jgi:ribosomal protein S12 methylthiotransferase accessory factor